MSRRAPRVRLAPRMESLERRCLLSTAGGPDPWQVRDPDPASSLLVGFRAGVTARTEAAVLRSVNAQVVATYPDGPVLVSTPSPSARDAAMRLLARSPVVRYAEPNAAFHIDATAANDPGLSRQWGLDQSNNVDIDAPQAWDVTQGKNATIVAVIDSGLDLSHPEFTGRVWTNLVEARGVSGADDDGDGLPDDVHGWNFLDNTANVADDNGHGTHVAGILGATGNNGQGLAGVNWNATIMPLKFIGADGNGSVDDAIRAIYYAVDHGARVINASWGGGDRVQALTDAISYANRRNVVFVTAAGNESANNGVKRSYPADDRLPNSISVAAVDSNGNLAGFSNFGATTVDLAAPGVNIRSTVPGGYATYSGTSMSAPFVSGVASLVIGMHPELTAAQAVQRILNAAKPLPGLKGKVITGGIVDAANAVSDSYAASHPGISAAGKKRPKGVAIVRRLNHTPVAKAPTKVKGEAAAIRG